MREMQWVRPELVAQIRFVEWTAEGRLRHAAFLGLRSDKSARKVWREATENIRDGMNSTRSGPHAGCASGIGAERVVEQRAVALWEWTRASKMVRPPVGQTK